MQKYLFITLSVICLMTFHFANAQVFKQSTTNSKVEEQKIPENISEPKVEKTNSNEDTASQKELKGIPVKLSEEQKEAADEALRNNLRDITKKDELKTRIEFLEANNYQDKVILRRELMKNGNNFRLSSHAADNIKKANVNPKSDSQMNEYIFERSGVAENKASNDQ